ncbi:MAG: peptidyl-prolyl cis-trans isomerase [Deltaproteobacteria bacterium]|nr:peptidyl-prolyl cis-trans isomerase [Deltaproteobacteria bacterium]MBW2306315.1 peptidyl-prolyl cis-trans isomerase [Deltaproteobacteria bacterium]
MKLSNFSIALLAAIMILGGYLHAGDTAYNKEDPSTVLAKVGDRLITLFDLEQALMTIPSEFRKEYSTPEGRKDLLQKLIDLHLFEMEARKIGLDKDNAIRTRLETLERNFLSKQLVLYFIREERRPPSEDDLRAYYHEHISDYTRPEEVLARHILVRTKKEAEEILVLLKDGGDFSRLARDRSIAPDAGNGGLLTWFSRGKMLPSFEKAVFQLKKGEISDVVWTRYGYHIVKLEDRKPAYAQPFEKVKNTIYADLIKSLQDDAVRTLRKRIMKNVSVKILDQRYAQESEETSTR